MSCFILILVFCIYTSISADRNTCQKRWWDLWCRENGSLLLKWRGCWASVDLHRENDTSDRLAWLPRSIVGCRLRRLVVPSGRKCSRRFFQKSEDRWCDLKRFPEMGRNLILGPDQRLFVLGDEVRLSRMCSCCSVPLAWFGCKYSIDAAAPPYRGARIRTRVEWRGWELKELPIWW